MPDNKYSRQSYFDLSRHSALQLGIFIILLILGIVMAMYILFPTFESFFKVSLRSDIVFDGTKIPYALDGKDSVISTNYYYNWGVHVYKDSPNESRYWFNPVLAMISTAMIFGLLLAVIVSSFLPLRLGYIRQKIEREISSQLSRFHNFGIYSDTPNINDIADHIIHADLEEMKEFTEDLNITLEDMKILQRAIVWQKSSFLNKLIHLNDGITMYMRFYFTIQYSNALLGFVYIGAAVLIIIVGLRGLKFIPPTEPSVVLFALGLEFSLLLTYALNLMYSRQEEETDNHRSYGGSEGYLLSSDMGSSREVEKLLRVFIRTSNKPDKPDDNNR